MKKVVIRLIALAMVLTLIGCQNAGSMDDKYSEQTQATELQTIELQSVAETDALESESTLNLPVSTKTIAEMVQAPERMVYAFENQSGEPGIDAEIIIPTTENMSVFSVKEKIFTEEEIETLYTKFFHKNAVYADQRMIDMFSQCIAQRLEPTAIERVFDWNRWCYETLDYLLGEMSLGEAPDFSLHTFETIFGDIINCCWLLALNGDTIQSLLIVENNVCFSTIPMTSMDILDWQFKECFDDYDKTMEVLHGEEYVNAGGTVIGFELQERDPEYLYNQDVGGLDYKDVKTESLSFLEACGINNQNVFFIKETNDYVSSVELGVEELTEIRGLRLESRNCYDNTNIIKVGTNLDARDGTTTMTWFADGLWSMNMHGMITVEEVLAENVELLPFERIDENVRNYIEKWLELEENPSLIMQVPANKIRLEYALVEDEASGKNVLIPVWNFYEARTYGVNYNIIENEDADDYAFSMYTLLLSVNAMDGSIIDMFPTVQQ